MSEILIDTGAIVANYTLIKEKVGSRCEVAGVVKANAYGCGVASTAKALQKAGCKTFFVATLSEATELRNIVGELPRIAMFEGYDHRHADIYKDNTIMPVLNHEDQAKIYEGDAMLHIDTGMNRLGYSCKTPPNPEDFEKINLQAIMTHFTSAEEHENPKSAQQVMAFLDATKEFQNIPKSVCNSAGVFHNADWHYDMVRPGMALYGLNPTPNALNPMQPVVHINATVLQIREIQKDETCGYNETYRFNEGVRLATVAIGYADGFLRTLSNTGKLYWKGIPCPIRGRVSMDTTIVDLRNIPENSLPKPGDMMEVIGPNQSADDLAADADTIGYEILTSLSRRFTRKYV